MEQVFTGVDVPITQQTVTIHCGLIQTLVIKIISSVPQDKPVYFDSLLERSTL